MPSFTWFNDSCTCTLGRWILFFLLLCSHSSFSVYVCVCLFLQPTFTKSTMWTLMPNEYIYTMCPSTNAHSQCDDSIWYVHMISTNISFLSSFMRTAFEYRRIHRGIVQVSDRIRTTWLNACMCVSTRNIYKETKVRAWLSGISQWNIFRCTFLIR